MSEDTFDQEDLEKLDNELRELLEDGQLASALPYPKEKGRKKQRRGHYTGKDDLEDTANTSKVYLVLAISEDKQTATLTIRPYLPSPLALDDVVTFLTENNIEEELIIKENEKQQEFKIMVR